ncbi:hypothetical protein ACG33_15130 [Steroidobacter denitrificans]|uniref:Phosphoribosyltransferase domain-containing protein n=1 Tax=Steroidobacter denitrificans TaxID=465721 RepID=A0A127FDE3_STEDE|nr:phosphoribosyltransferase family protein [Steroidobacter denitrificans]AMN48406.1 hypothetical protein ACG33_15130 [Steroidobacter denitrificans]
MNISFDDSAHVFVDRSEAGRELGAWFRQRPPMGELIILGLPRGGVPVARELADTLDAPLDVLLVRKLGAPFNPEFAAGAVAAGGIIVYNADAFTARTLEKRDLEPIIEREKAELARREQVYRAGRPPLAIEGKTVILVDDGIATGSTMQAAVDAARKMQAGQVIVAVPTASRQALDELERSADLVVALCAPEPYIAVGRWYKYFPQIQDREVVELLSAYEPRHAGYEVSGKS